jgi:8-oxo-dGTP diphosphatase
MIFDRHGHLLILEPTYKKRWTIPGGQMEADGETPWEACQRETREECGLEVPHGRLACVDFLRPKQGRVGGARFLFDCGAITDDQVAQISLQDDEIQAHRFVALDEANTLLSGPVGRRVAAAAGTSHCLYLEEGRPVSGVG